VSFKDFFLPFEDNKQVNRDTDSLFQQGKNWDPGGLGRQLEATFLMWWRVERSQM
jgi:hypothetical protein